jgi:YidC/Oxa1 family membrane protein insertase
MKNMSNEKRFFLCMLLTFAWMMGWPYVARQMGWAPEPKKPQAAVVAGKDQEKKGELAVPSKDADKAKAETAKPEVAAKKAETPTVPTAPKKPDVELVPATELILGSTADKDPAAYRMQVQLTQEKAGVDSLYLTQFDAEFKDGVKVKLPLALIAHDPTWPPSLSLMVNAGNKPAVEPLAEGEDVIIAAAGQAEDWSDSVVWEVVKDEQGRIRRPVMVKVPDTDRTVEGQAVVFRTKSPSGVIVTKTFRLGKGIDGMEVELKFESPDQERKVVYNLIGPHDIPIEGEWYTGTFRDLIFGQLNGSSTVPMTHSAYDIAKSNGKQIDNTAMPLRYSGVENQYFATLLEPTPPPTGPDDRWDSRAVAIWHRDERHPDDLKMSDVAVRITSRPITVGPEQPVVHTYRLFAGPKTSEALHPYGAEDLVGYRKAGWFGIPGAPYLARYVITPTLAFTYGVTLRVSRFFGGNKGNYGVAIILLTILVRALMFPLGRKQALAAKKMQELQPHLKELQEKYKDDKEKQAKQQFALYKEHGVNPVAGCLPALIQLPIFVGLWQALNTSVPLRHATFLWIRDLAAPDMMFHFPIEVPFLGKWFNLLPFVVVSLMLVQTQLFSPPATSPETEQQQKIMKFMMIFMGVMFYKVPSGLGLYFITSSLWAIGERLLLPKVTHARPVVEAGQDEEGDAKGSGGGGKGGQHGNGSGARGGKPGPGGNGATALAKPRGRIAQFLDRVLEEARKDPTYRKVVDERDGKGREKEKGDPRPRPRRR